MGKGFWNSQNLIIPPQEFLNTLSVLISLIALVISARDLQGGVQSGLQLEEITELIKQNNESSAAYYDAILSTDEEDVGSIEKSNDELSETNENLKALIELTEKLVSQAENANVSEHEIALVVKKEAIIRNYPSRDGTIISFVYPDQVVIQLRVRSVLV